LLIGDELMRKKTWTILDAVNMAAIALLVGWLTFEQTHSFLLALLGVSLVGVVHWLSSPAILGKIIKPRDQESGQAEITASRGK
jgi:hypothetical protein